MKKVILIAFYFNQVNEIASKRLRALAKYLPQYGWEPIVIVPDLGDDPSINENMDCRIITTAYEDMFSHFLSKIKPSKENKIIEDDLKNQTEDSKLQEGSNGSEGSDSQKLMDSSSVSNPFVSKAISIAGEIFAYPDGMKYWYDSAFEIVSQIVEDEKIDAIISSSWPITCHTIAKDISDKYDIPWIADLRDLWNLNPYVSHTFIRDYFERRLELKTFENTDVLTTTTDLAARTLSTLHPNNKIVPILSGYDKDDFKFLESIIDEIDNSSVDCEAVGKIDNSSVDCEAVGGIDNSSVDSNNSTIVDDLRNKNNDSDKKNKLKFIYAGSLYGGKRDPTYLFKAIRQLEDESKIDSSRISIEFYGDSGNLEEIARSFNLLDIVKIGGKIPHEEVLKKQLESDILLLISWNNEKEKMFIPGKIYEYFALRKPVLSIGYKEGSLKELIDETKVGYHVSDLESTKEVLLDLYTGYFEKGKVELNSDINIEDYSMETMASKFAELLNEII